MPVLKDSAVIIESQGGTTELGGIVTAFKDSQGWWASLIAPAASVPPKAELVGRRVQVKGAAGLASAQVSDCVELLAPTPTVQVLLRGEGEVPFTGH